MRRQQVVVVLDASSTAPTVGVRGVERHDWLASPPHHDFVDVRPKPQSDVVLPL